MPREVVTFNNFNLGINSATNPNDIKDNELQDAINVDFGEIGTLKAFGTFNTSFLNDNTIQVTQKPGYGIFPFSVDAKTDGTTPWEGYYLAIAKMQSTSNTSEILIYNDPEEANGVPVMNNKINIPHTTSCVDSLVQYYQADGDLRIYDKENNFITQKWGYIPGNRHYFKGATSNNNLSGTNTYETSNAFVTAPNGGELVLINDQDNTAEDADTSAAPNAGDVDIILLASSQVGAASVPIGWGKTESETETYNFYASFVYDGNQESLATEIGSDVQLGGGQQASDTNDISIYPQVLASNWNKRITSIRLYYKKVESEQETLFFIEDFPTYIDNQSSENIASDTFNSLAGTVALLGDKSGKGDDGTNTLGDGVGKYCEVPPTVYTHSVMSGMDNRVESTDPKFHTAVIHNRRLYVGNVTHKTPESPSLERRYPDRMLKSLPNRFDVLPDNNFIDVVRGDGEDIVKLESYGNRLLQFKKRTLYIIATAGAEEYLEGTYDSMGVTHPMAVAVSPYGVMWVNEFGAYVFLGGKDAKPQNIIENKIDRDLWKSFINEDSQCFYLPVEKSFVVFSKSDDMSDNDDSIIEGYSFNLLTKSWTKFEDIVGTSSSATDISNVVNYLDSSGVTHTLFHESGGDIVKWRPLYVDDASTHQAANKWEVLTKNYSGNVPHIRKKFYKIYITYKSIYHSDPGVDVKAIITSSNPSDSGEYTLVPIDDFEMTGDAWKVASFKLSANDDSKGKNVYSMAIKLTGTGVNPDFEVNEISLVVRKKSAK